MSLNSNRFELTGKVTFVDFKALDSGTTKTRILITKKGRKEGEFESYGINFFGETADSVYSLIKKDDYVNIIGKLTYSKYVDKAGNNREEINLLGFEFKKVVYDEKAKQYVPAGQDAESDDVPW